MPDMSSSENVPQPSRIVDATRHSVALDLFACLVSAEETRRDEDRQKRPKDVAEFEKTYFGPEVGPIRRCFEAKMHRALGRGGALLDYGCGGVWWKDRYWNTADNVTGVEVDRGALEEIEAAFPKASLLYTSTGIVETERRFDTVLSSSVVGYILPEQADHHLRSCFELLKPGGRLILTRVLAYGLIPLLRSHRLVHVRGGSFVYHYTKHELIDALKSCGFINIKYHHLGVRLPLISWATQQKLYALAPILMTEVLPRILPFLRIQHMLTCEKPH